MHYNYSMKISIYMICVGKNREKYIKEGISEYQKRLSRFCQLKLIETEEIPIPEPCHENDQLQVLRLEAEEIQKKIPTPSELVSLDIQGKAFSSEDFALWLERYSSYASMPLVFIIGGSLGLDSSLLEKAKLRLSLSPMTFPHMLSRLIFLEQLYRAFKIMYREKYHK